MSYSKNNKNKNKQLIIINPPQKTIKHKKQTAIQIHALTHTKKKKRTPIDFAKKRFKSNQKN